MKSDAGTYLRTAILAACADSRSGVGEVEQKWAEFAGSCGPWGGGWRWRR